MVSKILLEGTEYEISDLNESARLLLQSHQSVTDKLTELKMLEVVLIRAKNSYLRGIRREIVKSKSGLLLDED